ncbi:DNA polymerase/3'-5' exonuclease PolX [Novibacillus thermophilus]|uniref:DNA-directed DNA polymerase n=1 Tax=Novibacillus thermophilus TaxID=1471761 RepID=A0A1U9K4G3_9BACL|nr:DNA polymerase/3'-5' exonuclease PolX [Novibacillus thermophilus]AQS54914.1 DNA polymerase/3'-5' exonuclease PolX [Novibacillus thermophilus]
MPSHRDIAEMLFELANYMEIDGENPYRANAYRRAGQAVEHLKRPLEEIKEDLQSVAGIGKGTAAVIREIIETGESSLLNEYREKLPKGLMSLLELPGLGPKSVKTLYKKLNVTNVSELEQAIRRQQVRTLPGFGAKSEAKLLEAIQRAGTRPERLPLGHVRPVAEEVLTQIQSIPEVVQASLAGSIRRMEETVKDVDIVVATEQPDHVAREVASLPAVEEVVNRGTTKVSVLVAADWLVQVDVRIVTPEQYATALHHFTGSKEHNVRIRQIAKEKGWKVSEYGVEQLADGRTLTFDEETHFYNELGLPYIPPELRQGKGETEVGLEQGLPDLVAEKDIRGDLHVHSQWSDGHCTIREMAEAAKSKGYEYVAVTDHSRSLVIAGGLSVEDLMKQREEIDRVNRELDGITVLAGVEVDILPDGRLDYPDDVLEQLDVVIASVHSAFGQDERTMTKRILRAVENPYVHVIAHPTGRLLNRRDSYALNLPEIFKRAADTGTVLELNANPNRLDLNDRHLRQAVEDYGVTIAINTDAHRAEHLHLITYGVGTARRGWLTRHHILNTLTLDKLVKRLKGKNHGS